MSRPRLQRPSPSLVISCLALFVALGGTGYAAVKITGADVQDASLTGRDVKDRSLSKRDFRGSLRGRAGPAGPAGPQGVKGDKGERGEPGESASVVWAVLNQDGTLRRGRGVMSVTGAVSSYAAVKFNRNINTCAIVVSIGRNGAGLSNGEPMADEFVANGFAPDTVLVRASDSAGAGAARSVHVVALC
jgi:hypothetical protein